MYVRFCPDEMIAPLVRFRTLKDTASIRANTTGRASKTITEPTTILPRPRVAPVAVVTAVSAVTDVDSTRAQAVPQRVAPAGLPGLQRAQENSSARSAWERATRKCRRGRTR